LNAGSLGLNAEAPDRIDEFVIEVCVPVENQISGSSIVRKGLAQLLHRPCARQVFGYVEVQDATAIMDDDKEAVEHAKGELGTVKKSIAAMASR